MSGPLTFLNLLMTDSDLDVPRPEQELTVEIRLFNNVHVSDNDVSSRADTDTHHSPVLQYLTADCTGPYLPDTQRHIHIVNVVDTQHSPVLQYLTADCTGPYLTDTH